MGTLLRGTMPLGELIVAAFDLAAEHTTDAREISRLATGAVGRMLRVVGRAPRPAIAASAAPPSTRWTRH